MKIDNRALNLAETRLINQIINEEWQDSRDVDREVFIKESFGPNAIELLNGGELWIVCDRDDIDMIVFKDKDNRVTWVACHCLFVECAKYTDIIKVEQECPILNSGYDSPIFAISHRPFN